MFENFAFSLWAGADKWHLDSPFGAVKLHISAKDSVLGHGIPNFYFHLATAYAILRSKGVPVGKKDWILEFFRPEVEFP